MLTKEQIINGVIKIEGGYVNDPNDLGGETNFGITKKVACLHYKGLKENFNWDGKMKSFTKEMAFYIYEKDYWDSIKLDEIYSIMPLLAEKLFDIGVNVGVGRAGKWLQEIINSLNNNKFDDLVIDGKVGNKTIEALKTLSKQRSSSGIEGAILKGLFCLQGAHYIQISNLRPANKHFAYGWFARLNHRIDEYVQAFKRK